MTKKSILYNSIIDKLTKNRILSLSKYILNNPTSIGMPLFSDSDELSIVSWNIYKQQRQNWNSVLNKLVIDNCLILLQEAQISPQLIDFIVSQHLIADQVPAITYNQHISGVMTLAKVYPIYCHPLYEKEPLLRLQKSALITVYPLHNGQNLMIINIHAINFSFGVYIYSRQLHNIKDHIKTHKGPVIFAGDFNTWSRQRINVLKHLILSLQMEEVNFNPDVRTLIFGYPLDYVFYRSLTLIDAKVIKTNSSNHNPILVKFSIK